MLCQAGAGSKCKEGKAEGKAGRAEEEGAGREERTPRIRSMRVTKCQMDLFVCLSVACLCGRPFWSERKTRKRSEGRRWCMEDKIEGGSDM